MKSINTRTEKSENRSRRIHLGVRVTEDERDFIMAKMAQSGLKYFNSYALKMLIMGEIKSVDLSHYHELAKEVNRIGTNINQIAKVVNASGKIYETEITEIKMRLDEIWLLLKSSLSALR